jgi:hypothetical protein
MSITPYVDDFDVDLEKGVLGAALEMTRVSLGLDDKFADGLIASRIVELAKRRRAQSQSPVRRRSREVTRAFVRRLSPNQNKEGAGRCGCGEGCVMKWR